jgi:hypothetical protein
MLTVSLRRKTLLLLLVAILFTPWASAASLQHASPQGGQAAESVPLLGHFWHLIWGKAGCHIDPNDRCTNSAAKKPPLQTKAGCRLDPDGRCIA